MTTPSADPTEALDAIQDALEWREVERAEAMLDALAPAMDAATPRQQALFAHVAARARRSPAGWRERTALAWRLATELGDAELMAAALAVSSARFAGELGGQQLRRARALLPDDASERIRHFVAFREAVYKLYAIDADAGPCRRLATLPPNRPGAGYGARVAVALAASAAQNRNVSEAIRWADASLDRADRPTPVRASALLKRADLALVEGRSDLAESLCEQAGPLVSGTGSLQGPRAMILAALGRIDEARALLDAVASAPGQLTEQWIRVHRGFVHLHAGELDRAAAEMRRADSEASPVEVASTALLEHATSVKTRVDDLEQAVELLGVDTDVQMALEHALRRRPDPWDAGSMRIRRARLRLARASTRSGAIGSHIAELRERPGDSPLPLDAFDLLEGLGEGATGNVYLGRHHHTGDLAAVKILHADGIDLTQEAALVAGLRHPHIVAVLAVGAVDGFLAEVRPETFRAGTVYVAMEAVMGGTLDPWCGRLPWDTTRTVLLSLLDALAHAHASGVLHLDLKPANVLVEPTRDGFIVKLADFGVASLLSALERGAKRVAGTPYYMAPEQWSGRLQDLGPWTDLYAFGVMAYQLISGRPPFESGDFHELADNHRNAERPALVSTQPVPQGLDAWVQRLFHRDPAERFGSAAAAATALRAISGPLEGGTREVPDSTERATEFLTGTFHTELDPYILHLARSRGADETLVPRQWRTHPVSEICTALPRVARARLAVGPLYGMEATQDALWTVLRRTGELGEARVLGLVPTAGGTARALTDWLVSRARECGLPGHQVDLDAADWPSQVIAACASRTGLPNTDPAQVFAARFPDFEMSDLETPSEADAMRVLRADLGVGASVLVLRGSGGARWIEKLRLQPCLIVTLGTDDVEPEQRLAVPRLSTDAVARTLQERIPVTPELARRIARIAGGHVDAALDMLRALIDQRGLVLAGRSWRLAPGARLPDRPPYHPDHVLTRYLDGGTDDAALVIAAILAGLPLTDERCIALEDEVGGSASRAEGELRSLGLLDAEGRVIEGTDDAVAAWIKRHGMDLVERSAMSVSASPLHHSRVLLQLGRGDEALDVLLDAATELATRRRTDQAPPLLDAAVALVGDDLGLALPARYHLLRGLTLRHPDPEAAHRYFMRATRDSETASRAWDALSTLPGTPLETSAAHLQRALDAAPRPQRGVLNTKLAVVFMRLGRDVEALALMRAVLDADPDALGPRYGLLGLTQPFEPDPDWLDALETLAVDASENASMGPLCWMQLAVTGVMWNDPDIRDRGRAQLAPVNQAWIDAFDAVGSSDTPRLRELLSGPYAADFAERNAYAAMRIWLDIDGPVGLWRETLAHHRYDGRALGATRWVLEHARKKARAADRRGAIDAMLSV